MDDKNPEELFLNPEYLRIHWWDLDKTPFCTGPFFKVPVKKFP